MLWWNIQTGWVHVMALHDRSGVEHSFGIHPMQVLLYLAGQLGVVSPLIMIGMVVAAVGMYLRHRDEPRVKHLLTQFVPLQALFLFSASTKWARQTGLRRP